MTAPRRDPATAVTTAAVTTPVTLGAAGTGAAAPGSVGTTPAGTIPTVTGAAAPGTVAGRPERGTLRVLVDRDACCGSGNCVTQAPELFDQDERDGLVRARTDRPASELIPAARTAAHLCPTGAITVEET